MKPPRNPGLMLLWLMSGVHARRAPLRRVMPVVLYIAFIVFLLFLGVVLNMQAGTRH